MMFFNSYNIPERPVSKRRRSLKNFTCDMLVVAGFVLSIGIVWMLVVLAISL